MVKTSQTVIPVERPDAVYRQIADYFIGELTNGNLAENDRIPPTTELARMFQVTPVTVQQGLKLLTRRGILQRTPGRGTFVRRGFARKTAGFIFGREVFTQADKLFYGAVLEQLTGLCTENGWDYRLYPTAEFVTDDRAFRDLKSAVDDGVLGAVIEFCSNDFVGHYLETQCPAPVNRTVVPIDYPRMYELGVRHLRRQGARRILVLGWDYPTLILPDGDPGVERLQCEIHLAAGTPEAAEFFEKVGEAMTRRPDGMLIFLDTMLQPAIIAALQAGLRIPEDLKLITHANRGRDYFFNRPLTKLEIDPADYAREVWNGLQATLAGREYQYTPVRPTLVVGKTCGE